MTSSHIRYSYTDSPEIWARSVVATSAPRQSAALSEALFHDIHLQGTGSQAKTFREPSPRQ